MGDFNMPPGVSVNDIPGNRPEDLREDAFWETVDARFTEKVGNAEAGHFFDLIDGGSEDNNIDYSKLLYEYTSIARYTEGQDAFDQGKQEAEMTENEIQNAMLEWELVEAGFCSKYNRARQEVLRRWNSKD